VNYAGFQSGGKCVYIMVHNRRQVTSDDNLTKSRLISQPRR